MRNSGQDIFQKIRSQLIDKKISLPNFAEFFRWWRFEINRQKLWGLKSFGLGSGFEAKLHDVSFKIGLLECGSKVEQQILAKKNDFCRVNLRWIIGYCHKKPGLENRVKLHFTEKGLNNWPLIAISDFRNTPIFHWTNSDLGQQLRSWNACLWRSLRL